MDGLERGAAWRGCGCGDVGGDRDVDCCWLGDVGELAAGSEEEGNGKGGFVGGEEEEGEREGEGERN